MAYQPISEQLNEAETALDNALNNQTLLDALTLFGYDEATLQEGQVLLETAQDAQQTMAAEYSEQYDATDALDATYETADTIYMRHLKIARVALKDQRGAAEALKLGGDRKRTISGWLDQTRTFYDNALADADVQAALGQFGITPDDLTAAQTQVEAVADANSTQEQEKGDAQDATEARDAAVDALDGWMSDFRAIARVALEDQPQQLEKLGIAAPSAVIRTRSCRHPDRHWVRRRRADAPSVRSVSRNSLRVMRLRKVVAPLGVDTTPTDDDIAVDWMRRAPVFNGAHGRFRRVEWSPSIAPLRY